MEQFRDLEDDLHERIILKRIIIYSFTVY